MSVGGAKAKSFWLTDELLKEISLRLKKGEQSLIFINRRGSAFFVQCKKCGFIPRCAFCSVSLTPHGIGGSAFLECHYCGFRRNFPDSCDSCGSSRKDLLSRGVGTEKILSSLREIFPSARIENYDLTVSRKKIWPRE